MGIIDVIVEKPAFKRATGTERSMDETNGAEHDETSTPRGRTALKTIGAMAIGVLGIVTFRKYRQRNGNA